MKGKAEGAKMANVKKGLLTTPGEWWKHLRWTKRVFWKGERQAGKRETRLQSGAMTQASRNERS